MKDFLSGMVERKRNGVDRGVKKVRRNRGEDGSVEADADACD